MYRGTSVSSVDLVRWTITNIGTVPVIESDFAVPLALSLNDAAQPLSTEIEHAEPLDLGPTVSIAGSRIVVAPLLLNPGDSLTVATLVGNYAAPPLVSGRVAGVTLIDADKAAAAQLKRLKRRATVSAASAAAAVLLALAIGLDSNDSGASGPTFKVTNTEETEPDGIFFRESPHVNHTKRISGLGVYKGERVRVICYAQGDPVGPFMNLVWYLVANVDRPSVDDQVNSGWLSARYIDDGQAANSVSPDVEKRRGDKGG